MLTPVAIKGFTSARPFRSFQLEMASGETFDVRHPEMLVVHGNHLLWHGAADAGVALSMMLLESLRPLPESASPARETRS